MYKVTGKENDMFKVLDLDEGTEELLSAEQLVLALGVAEIDGCQHSENGIEVWYDGVEKYEIPIEVWAPVRSPYNRLFSDGIWHYEVSNLGGMRSTHAVNRNSIKLYDTPKILTGGLSCGYRQMQLSSGYGKHCLYFHVAVATVFVFNKRGLPIVNHLDELRSNNAAYNLEWCTHRENVHYGTALSKIAQAKSKRVRQYSLCGDIVNEFDSTVQASEETGIYRNSISKCCRRTRLVCDGFVFRYVEDDELFDDAPDSVVEYVNSRYTRCKNGQLLRQYTVTGVLVFDGISVKEARERFNFESAFIRRRLSAYGYVWRFLYDDELYDLSESDRMLVISGDSKRYSIMSVRQYTLSGSFICEFRSIKSAARSSGANETSVGKVCKRLSGFKSAAGFIWRYAHDDEFADRPENVKAIEEWRKRESGE